jgi:hypothetical protein
MADQLATVYKTGFSGVTYTDIANLTGKTLTATEQALITDFIKGVESYICSQTHRQFAIADGVNKQSFYQVFDGGFSKYYLISYPIYRVTKIQIDGVTKYDVATPNNNTLNLNVDFFVYDDFVRFITFPVSSIDNRRAVKIYYELEDFWGEEVKLAIKRFVSELFLSREYGTKGVNSFDVAGQLSMSFNSELGAFLKEVIESYKIVLV